MSEGTFENDGDEAEGLATGAGPTQSGGEQQQNQGDGSEQDASDIHDDLENKAEEHNDSSAGQHRSNALDDVNLEPPSA